MQTIIETPEFIRCSKKVGLSEIERNNLISALARNPKSGDEISGTGGMRKLRVASTGRGKSGSYRVITFFSGVGIPVFLITIYAKNQKDNVSEKEKNLLRSFSKNIVEVYRRNRSE